MKFFAKFPLNPPDCSLKVSNYSGYSCSNTQREFKISLECEGDEWFTILGSASNITNWFSHRWEFLRISIISLLPTISAVGLGIANIGNFLSIEDIR